jgi:DNA-binding MarR family transcriptional regulator
MEKFVDLVDEVILKPRDIRKIENKKKLKVLLKKASLEGRKYTLVDLAKDLGVTNTTVARYIKELKKEEK